MSLLPNFQSAVSPVTSLVNGPSTFSQFAPSNVNSPGASIQYSTLLLSFPTNAPIGVVQIGPFEFDYRGSESVQLESEITDHFLEDNTAFQDHIAIRPALVSLHGKVSELTLNPQTTGLILNALSTVECSLSQADAYLGSYTPGATQALLQAITQAQNVAVQIEQAAARTSQIMSFFGLGGIQKTKQQAAYATLCALRLAKVVFTVQTPFQVFYNMVIKGITADQTEKSKTISDFTVHLKQLQFVNNISVAAFQAQYFGNAVYGNQPQVSNGVTRGISTTLAAVKSVF